MSKLRAWVLSPLLFLPAVAQEAQVLPETEIPPEVDTITPVPSPEIPFGGGELLAPSLPDYVQIENRGGRIEGDLEGGIRYGGPVKMTGDNGLEVFANTAVWSIREKTITLEGDVSIYRGNVLQRGESAVYFYERKFLDIRGLRA